MTNKENTEQLYHLTLTADQANYLVLILNNTKSTLDNCEQQLGTINDMIFGLGVDVNKELVNIVDKLNDKSDHLSNILYKLRSSSQHGSSTNDPDIELLQETL